MIINREKIQIINLLKLSLNFFIRMKNKTSIDKIVKINNIENPEKIDIGQKILVIR